MLPADLTALINPSPATQDRGPAQEMLSAAPGAILTVLGGLLQLQARGIVEVKARGWGWGWGLRTA